MYSPTSPPASPPASPETTDYAPNRNQYPWFPISDETGLVVPKEKTEKKSLEILEIEGESPRPDPVKIPKVSNSWVVKRTMRHMVSEEMVTKRFYTRTFLTSIHNEKQLTKAIAELEKANSTIMELRDQKKDLESEILKAQMSDWRESMKVNALKRAIDQLTQASALVKE